MGGLVADVSRNGVRDQLVVTRVAPVVTLASSRTGYVAQIRMASLLGELVDCPLTPDLRLDPQGIRQFQIAGDDGYRRLDGTTGRLTRW